MSSQAQDIQKIVLEQAEMKKVIDAFCRTNEKTIIEGNRIDADFFYSCVYASAKKSIYIIDNYICLRTLLPLKNMHNGVECTIVSNFKDKKFDVRELDVFKQDKPKAKISVKRQTGRIHDRFIVIDYGTKHEKIYHCGSSSNGVGTSTSIVTIITDEKVRKIIEKQLS